MFYGTLTRTRTTGEAQRYNRWAKPYMLGNATQAAEQHLVLQRKSRA